MLKNSGVLGGGGGYQLGACCFDNWKKIPCAWTKLTEPPRLTEEGGAKGVTCQGGRGGPRTGDLTGEKRGGSILLN